MLAFSFRSEVHGCCFVDLMECEVFALVILKECGMFDFWSNGERWWFLCAVFGVRAVRVAPPADVEVWATDRSR